MSIKNRTAYAFLLLPALLIGCTESRFQEAPLQEFSQVGFYGHGRGVLGDMGINIFGFERRCDSCHAQPVKNHQSLGNCNQCHQPHNAGWSSSLVARSHNNSMAIRDTLYHGKLSCTECHQDISSRSAFMKTSCNHCHNHNPSDMRYCHELMDEYEHLNFTENKGCIECHTFRGPQFEKYFDPITKELL